MSSSGGGRPPPRRARTTTTPATSATRTARVRRENRRSRGASLIGRRDRHARSSTPRAISSSWLGVGLVLRPRGGLRLRRGRQAGEQCERATAVGSGSRLRLPDERQRASKRRHRGPRRRSAATQLRDRQRDGGGREDDGEENEQARREPGGDPPVRRRRFGLEDEGRPRLARGARGEAARDDDRRPGRVDSHGATRAATDGRSERRQRQLRGGAGRDARGGAADELKREAPRDETPGARRRRIARLDDPRPGRRQRSRSWTGRRPSCRRRRSPSRRRDRRRAPLPA